MNVTANSKQRRRFLKLSGMLRKKGKQPFKQWREEVRSNIAAGKEMHQAHLDSTDKALQEIAEAREERQIKNWRELGYSDSNIEKLREADALLTVRDKETWKRDKKRAREIMREVKTEQ